MIPPLSAFGLRFRLVAATAVAITGATTPTAQQQVIPACAPKTILVRFDAGPMKPGAGALGFDAVAERLGLSHPADIVPRPARRERPARQAFPLWQNYRISGPLSPDQIADSLNRIPGITAQPNRYYRFLSALEEPKPAARPPNDPRWAEQWGPKIVGFESVWEYVRDHARDSVVVGVIDSGVDYEHPEIAPRIWRNLAEVNGIPGVDDDGNGYVDDHMGWDFTDAPDLPGRGDYRERDNDPMDEGGHGTNVAGVIVAELDNGVGIAGIAPTAKVMMLRAGAELAFGGALLEEDDIAAAMIYAADNGARIINMSFGDDVSSPLMLDAVRYADAAGVLLVASSGNDAGPTIIYPAAYDETVAVGATTDQDVKAGFSSYGENLDVTAPGVGILTTSAGTRERGAPAYNKNGGTSFSSPHVCGAAAIVLSLAPHLTPVQLRSMLRAGVADLGPPGWDAETGFGRLHLPTLLAVATDPVGEIRSPNRPAGADTAMAWSVEVRGAPPVAWSLSYGVGPTPRLWTSLASGALEGPQGTASGSLNTATLRDTTYSLRLVVSDALGRSREDRTLFTVDHTAPQFTLPLTIRRRWEDTREKIVLEWTADDATLGVLRIWRGNEAVGAPTVELPVSVEDRHHVEELAREIGPGEAFAAQVRAVNRAGLSAESAVVNGAVQAFAIPQSGFETIAKLPSGVLMPGVSDFNRNGVPEIALKPATRDPYDYVSFYELTPTGKPKFLWDSLVKMRPSAVVDIDGDGRLDLVGYAYVEWRFYVRIGEETALNRPPEEIWWAMEFTLAPTVGDVDADGWVDMIALTDTNRAILRVYEGGGPGIVVEKARLISPVSGIGGRFGIWRAVGDVDGDGRNEVIAGTTGGNVVIFPNTGDDAFGQPRVIPGTGDATRVWGGIDVTGDGRANFAVLRHVEEDRYDFSAQYFRFELYGSDPEPILTREFADPRTEGNGFAAGPVGPNGEQAFVFALPPRLYILTPSAAGVDGFTWYAETIGPAQPLIADVDGVDGAELVYQALDSVRIVRRLTGITAPPAPKNLVVRAQDSVSVEVTWDVEPGLEYRLWAGPNADDLAPATAGHATSPALIESLTEDVPIFVAVQAINAAQSDSLGALSEPVKAIPRPGPHLVRAALVAPERVIAEFDRRLSSLDTGPASFALVVGGDRTTPATLILDRTERRAVLGLPSGSLDGDALAGLILAFDVRDSTGARRAGTAPIIADLSPPVPGIAYAVVLEGNRLRFGFSVAVDAASVTPSSVFLVGGPAVAGVSRAGGDGMDFDATFAGPISENQTFVLDVRDVRAQDGRVFSGGAVVHGTSLSAQPPKIVAVLQMRSTEVWLVTNVEFTHAPKPQEILFTPRLTVNAAALGPHPSVIVVTLDSDTPAGAWESLYRVALSLEWQGEYRVIETTFQPLADRPYTGHLRSVAALDRTTLRLEFELLIAETGHPERPIRVEPGLVVESFTVADSVVTVRLSDRTRLGPWGIGYFVHVDGLFAENGESLTELYALTPEAPPTFADLTVFPQPYRPLADVPLRFGGLPAGAKVRIYGLDGRLVRAFLPTDTGGVEWDGRTEGGRIVGAGVYLYVIETPTEQRMGKLAVLR